MDELKIANRLKSLPVLMSTCIWFSQNYERLKATNPLIRQTCELAETTVQASVHAVTDPLAARFKPQLDVLDCLACNQLDRLAHAFPLINKDMPTILNESKSMLLGTNLVAHKFLDRVEKSLISQAAAAAANNKLLQQESKIAAASSSGSSSKSSSEQSTSTTTNREKEDAQQQEQQLVVHSYPPLTVRARLVALMLYQLVKARVNAHLHLAFVLLKHSCPCVEAMSKRADGWRRTALYTLHDRFSFTKDKLDLYKEYLDVLMRQFMVQDGRSLEHVHSLEERTKIIIRRNIGNLLIIIQLISTNVNKLAAYILNNAVIAFSKKTLCQISELFYKPNNEKLTQALISKLISVQSSALQWMVPNFDAFGVLDELDEEMSTSSSSLPSSPVYFFFNSDSTQRPSSESIRRQLALLGEFELATTTPPLWTRSLSAKESSTLSSNFSTS